MKHLKHAFETLAKTLEKATAKHTQYPDKTFTRHL
jgi:hypothetical protein